MTFLHRFLRTLQPLRLTLAMSLAATLVFPTSVLWTQTSVASAGQWAAGHWEGEIELPDGAGKLGVIINLRAPEGDGPWSGTIDIPAQGAKDLPLSEIVIEATRATFAIGSVPGQPVFQGALKDGKISGSFSQGDLALPFTLGRERTVQTAKPQDPKPPFPYKIDEVTYQNGAIKIAGTLNIPAGTGPFPAVLLITGSGSQDRDETIFGHHPFWILADHLCRQGIAVLRADDRGMGGSSGNPETATSADLAQDVLAGVRFLKEQPAIDPARIGLLGHSEGGVIAPLAASQSPDVAFLVLLAGTGVPGEEIVLKQIELIARADGDGEEAIATQVARQKRIFNALRTMSPADADAEIRRVISLSLQDLSIEKVRSMGGAITVTERQIKQLTSPWFRFFATFDPRVALRQLKRPPLLALNGERDLQVSADQNLPEIEKALQAAGNKDVTVVKLPGLNHLFQPALTGSPVEYAGSEVTIDPAVLERISSWIRARFVHPQPAAKK